MVVMRSVAALLTALALGACTNQIDGRATAAREPGSAKAVDTAAPTPSQSRKTPYDGVWTGTYTCAQGDTGLRLSIDGIDAVFAFFAVPSNPRVPDGKFAMTFDVAAKTFTQRGWLEQPGGFLMVDFVAGEELSARRIAGKVLGPGCTTFAVTRGAD